MLSRLLLQDPWSSHLEVLRCFLFPFWFASSLKSKRLTEMCLGVVASQPRFLGRLAASQQAFLEVRRLSLGFSLNIDSLACFWFIILGTPIRHRLHFFSFFFFLLISCFYCFFTTPFSLFLYFHSLPCLFARPAPPPRFMSLLRALWLHLCLGEELPQLQSHSHVQSALLSQVSRILSISVPVFEIWTPCVFSPHEMLV